MARVHWNPRWLYRRARGIDGTPVNSSPGRKSVSREETFSLDLNSDEELNSQLTRLALRVASDLRGKTMQARTITVKIRDADFARETALLTRAQILSQAGTSVLATANLSAQNVLALLG